MQQSKRSLFDNIRSPKNIWSKEANGCLSKDVELNCEGYFMKYSKTKQNYRSRYFTLSNGTLFNMKKRGSRELKGSLVLKWVRNYYSEEIIEGKQVYSITFAMNMKYSMFIVENENEFLKWKKSLSKVCIQTNFEQTLKIVEKIGEGSSASVYLCKDNESDKQYAVIVYKKSYLEIDESNRESLIHEISILMTIQHPNVIKLKRVFESETSIYLVMDYIKGVELSKKISMKYQFTYSEIRKTFKTLLDCLVYFDSLGIVHRDLQPSNLIVIKGEYGSIDEIKIIDFGLSIFKDSSKTIMLCGTPGYIAPELINSNTEGLKNYTVKSDLFSVGMIIYCMVHNFNPFNAQTKEKTMECNKNCKVFYGNRRLSRIPHLNNLLTNIITADPSKRIEPQKALRSSFFDNESLTELPLDNGNDTNHCFNTSKLNRKSQKRILGGDEDYTNRESLVSIQVYNSKKSTKKLLRSSRYELS